MKIVIAGAGEVGSHLAKMLSNESNDITVIDSEPSRLEALTASSDVITVTGNPSSIEVLKEAGCEDADLFIAVNPSASQDVNIVSCLLLPPCQKAREQEGNRPYRHRRIPHL